MIERNRKNQENVSKGIDLETRGNQIPVFTLTIEQLEPLIKSWIRDCLDFGPVTQTSDLPKLYTRTEAAEMLHISLPTLNSYTKLGLIRATRTGTRVLYSEVDLKEALKEIPSKLSRR